MSAKLPFKTWKYEDQTKIKHLVFSDYFDIWVKILGKYNPLNYIDGFGGIGAYKDNGKIHWGSPVLAVQIINSNNFNLKRDPSKVAIGIIDEKKSNLDNINKIIEYLKLEINPTYINDDFDKTVNGMLDETPNLAPTFFLIDPFGFKIKLSTIERIMKIPKSEILLNFMWNGINRNLKNEQAMKIVNSLYESSEWQQYISLPKENKERNLVELYRKQLKKFCKYVCYYRISFAKMARTYYYLFHLTNHIKGCSIMKSSFAKFNFGRVEYRGKTKYQKTLFEDKDTKVAEIKKILLSQCRNTRQRYIEILDSYIDETPYLESEFLAAIKDLESDGDINVIRKPDQTPKGRKRRSILYSDKIVC